MMAWSTRGIELTPELPLPELAELATAAEAAGFDAALASCHYFNRDPFQALGRIAAATETIRVGPAAANPYETHPVALASRMATLQETSGGRGLLGLGPGDPSALAALGVERDRPLRRVLETLRVSRALWAGERVTHDGTFTAREAGLEYAVEPAPVYVGAQGPGMLRMAAKHADGALYNAAHPRDVAWASDQVEAGLAERDGGPFEFVAFASVSVAGDAGAAREAARPAVAFIAAGAGEPVLERHGIDAEAARVVGEHIEAGDIRAAMDAVTPAMIDAFAAAGTPAEVGERLAAVGEHADGIVAGTPLGPDRRDAIGLLEEALTAATD